MPMIRIELFTFPSGPSYSIGIEHSGSSTSPFWKIAPTVAAPHAVTSSLFNVLLSWLCCQESSQFP